MKANIYGIVENSIVDGPGIRFTVFFQGCPHHCKGCHNPGSWQYNCGTQLDISDLEHMISTNALLDGLTLSGGEPFEQVLAAIELCKTAHKANLDVWCYTGYVFDDLMRSNDCLIHTLLNYIDVLVDGPFEEDKKSLGLLWKGSSNQRVINMVETRKKGEIVLYDEREYLSEDGFDD